MADERAADDTPDVETEEAPPAKQKIPTHDILVRVHSWTCWLPKSEDPNNPETSGVRGVTSLKMLPGEQLQELTATALPYEGDAVIGTGENGEEEKQEMQFYGFEAVLACQASTLMAFGHELKDLVDPQPSSEESSKMIEGYIKSIQAKQRMAIAKQMPSDHKAPGGKRRSR